MRFVAAILAGLLLVAGLAVFLWTSQTVEQQPVIEEPDTTEADLAAIQGLVEAWSTSFDSQDLEPYLALFSDDARFLPPESPALDGKETIRAWIAENFVDGPMTFSSGEREVMGAFAYDIGTFDLPIPQQGEQPRIIYGKYLLFMRRQADGSWELTHYMWNFTPPPEQ